MPVLQAFLRAVQPAFLRKKQVMHMIRKLVSLAVCLLAAAVLFCLPAAAAGGNGIYGTVQGQSAVLYLRSGDAAAAYSCLVGNTTAQAGQAQPLSAQQEPVHTVILLDNSLSIPQSQRPVIANILDGLAGSRLTGEQFTIATISGQVTTLCEGQSDYLQLKSVIDQIQYQDQSTKLTDCLYQVLDQLVQKNNATLTRIVLISDGVDDQEIGYTQQELTELIRKAGFPLYTIGAASGTVASNARLQNLFALSRLTDGASFSLGETQDVTTIVNGLRAWDSAVRLEVSLPAEVCDGSEKAVQVSDGGQTALTLSLTMPFAELPAAIEAPAATAAPTPAPTAAPAAEPEPEPQRSLLILPLAIGGGAAAVVLLIVLVVVLRRRRQRFEPAPQPVPAASQAAVTVFADRPAGEGQTAAFFGEGAQRQINITLTDLMNPVHSVTFPLSPCTTVGRDPAACRVVLDYDPSISRHQCDFCQRGADVVLVNRSSSNGTKVNGQKITGECKLISGSILKMGNAQLRVTIQ